MGCITDAMRITDVLNHVAYWNYLRLSFITLPDFTLVLTPTGKNQSIWVYGRSVCEHCLHYCVELPPCDAL